MKNNMETLLNEEEREQIAGEIDNDGFGYWIQQYGYNEDKDPKLKDLCAKAREAMNTLDRYLNDNDMIL